MKPSKTRKTAQEGSPENDDGSRSDGIPPNSYRALGEKIYEALTSLPLRKRILLARATSDEMSGDDMHSDPKLADVLRVLRYPDSPERAKKPKVKVIREN